MSSAMSFQKIAQLYKDMIGKRYRHFKGGLYEVIEVAVHTETEGIYVIYKDVEDPSLVWARPLSLFLARVDKDTYPRVRQEMRFEEIPAECAGERKE